MARTWSVPQRGSIAAIGGLRSQQNRPSRDLAAGRGLGGRGLFLIGAALLTAAGAIIPHLDSQLLSTLLFMAGAGLATVVVVLPSQASEPVVSTSGKKAADVPSAFSGETARQVRFPELLVATGGPQGLDRAAWARLTAHMSHELRTPLNAVLGFSEMMTNEVLGPLGSSYSAYARDIHASGRVLLKTAEDALAITALLTAPERKRVRETSCIRGIVDDACAFVAHDLAEKSIAVEIEVGGDAEIVGDHQAMRQMLINLITEASRRADAGAVLRFETNMTADSVNLTLALVTDGDCREDEGFGVILARTLCELSGAALTTFGGADGEWLTTVRFTRAAQADFFAAA